jgi:hypothetical protein
MVGRIDFSGEVAFGVFKFLEAWHFSEDPDGNKGEQEQKEKDHAYTGDPESLDELFLSLG